MLAGLLGFSALPEEGVILFSEGATGGEPSLLEGGYADVESGELFVEREGTTLVTLAKNCF